MNSIKDIAQRMVEVRHHLHRNPELSFQEVNTCAYIADYLRCNGVEYSIVADTGILAVVYGQKKGDDTLIRADIDALPITENSSCDFASTNGAMHACGHDIHTSVLLGLLIWLYANGDKFSGRVVGLFQPGEEESPGGASLVLASGVLDKFSITRAFALHCAHDIPVGEFGARAGQYMASTSEMRILVKGSGGHAALPDGMVNPILVASQFIQSLKELENRYFNVIIAIGRVIAEGSTNVIPQTVSMAGTVRAMTLEVKAELKREIIKIARLCGDIDISFSEGYPPIINDLELSRKSIELLKEKYKVRELGLRMTADDFGFFAERYPSFYYRIGVKGSWETLFAPHTPQFMAADESICYGIESMAELVVGEVLK